MTLELKRFAENENATLGALFIDGVLQCFTCEDEHRDVKKMHETRIPDGTYEIIERTYGGHYEKYCKKFSWHKGMLELKNVPGFSDILIHIGNTEKDTSGCILVGMTPTVALTVQDSAIAYASIYKKIINEINCNRTVKIKIRGV